MPAAASTIIDRIRRAAAAGRALPPEDGLALAQAIDMAERDDISIDEALGLPSGWQRSARIRKRDAALRDLTASMAGSDRERARTVRALLLRYATSAFPIDRRRGIAPDGDRGCLFAFLDASGGEIIGVEAIRKLLPSNETRG